MNGSSIGLGKKMTMLQYAIIAVNVLQIQYAIIALNMEEAAVIHERQKTRRTDQGIK